MSKPAAVRFYFDADITGTAKVICALRSDCTRPEDPGALIKGRQRPPCTITKDTKDRVWISQVAAAGWLIITRDSAIQRRRAEIQAVVEHHARLVALAAEDAHDTWSQLEVLFRQWRAIEHLLDEPGPIICEAKRTTLRRRDDLIGA